MYNQPFLNKYLVIFSNCRGGDRVGGRPVSGFKTSGYFLRKILINIIKSIFLSKYYYVFLPVITVIVDYLLPNISLIIIKDKLYTF